LTSKNACLFKTSLQLPPQWLLPRGPSHKSPLLLLPPSLLQLAAQLLQVRLKMLQLRSLKKRK
jgi:hypothetical protein